MTLRSIVVSGLLLAAGVQATVDDRLYPLDSRSLAPVKRQNQQNMVNVHVVQVGDMQGGLKFYPDNLQVPQGDMVQFQFYPRNHSLVQSTFDAPCEPISRSQPETAGIKSGFMPVQANARDIPVFTIMVNDTKPMWFYCGQGRHCQNGMVFAINPVSGSNKTIDSFRALAAQAGNSTSGGGSGGSGRTGPTNTIPNTSSPTATGASGQNAAGRLAANAAGLGGLLLTMAVVLL